MKNYLFLLVSFFAVSCGKVKQIDTSELQDIMKQSVVTKISDKELLVAAEIAADEQSKKIDNYILNNQCDSLKNLKNVRFINLNNIASSPYTKQQEVLLAYAFQAQEKKPLGKNLQQVQDTLYFFTSPIINQKGSCLEVKNCQLMEIELSKSKIVQKIVANKN